MDFTKHKLNNMKKLLIGWNVFRVARLLIGLAALVQGIVQKELLVLAAGSWILFGAVFKLGCCGSGGCSVHTSTQKTKKEVAYEEVDTVPNR
jgi:hypothetical protein